MFKNKKKRGIVHYCARMIICYLLFLILAKNFQTFWQGFDLSEVKVAPFV